MKVSRPIIVMSAGFLLALAGLVVAQDASFEALLQEISQPSPTQQPAAASQPDAAAPAAAAPAAEMPAAEAPAAEAAAAEAVVAEPAPAAAPAAEAAAAPVAAAAEETVAPVAEEVVAAPAAAETETVAQPAAAELAPAPVEDVVAPAAEPAPEAEPAMQAEAAAPAVEEIPTAPVVEAPAAEAPAAPAEMAQEAMEGVQPLEEEAPAVEATAEEAAQPAPEEAKELARQEEIRRQARETQARKALDSGLKSAAGKDYEKAIKDLEVALAELPDRPANAKVRADAKAKLADAYARKAGDLLATRANLDEALAAADKARDYGHRDAESLTERIKKEQARQEEIARRPVPPAERKEYKDRQSEIQDLLTQGRQLYKIEDYNSAEAVYEKVLLKDEYNVEAMRYLRKIDEVRYKIKTKERQATEADMIQKVRDAWNPPIREEVSVPGALVGQTAVEKMTGAQKLQDKMAKITFPLIDFRQANIVDVVKFLNEESANLDPDGVGVNIILNLNIGGTMGSGEAAMQPAPAPAPADDLFGAPPAGQEPFGAAPVPAPAMLAPGTPTLTLSLRRVSLLNAIKYITEVAGLKYRVDEDAIIITPQGAVEGRVVTRLYPVQPTFLDVVVEKKEDTAQDRGGEFVAMGGASASIKKSDVREFFERAGVPFPQGTSITYNPGISQLIVANTPENLELFERILSQLNVIPNQVEIEARFVEIAQDDLEELGLQWILTDNWEMAMKEGNTPIAARERIQMNKNNSGLTQGLRFFELSESGVAPNSAALGLSPLGNIASFSSVLTNPELTVVIQALSQHGGSDLLSAPRVTTRSGVNAEIQVVREIIYPTEFESEVTSVQTQSEGGGTSEQRFVTITPGSFETRETGVILNVTPTVGPDGYTIDLVLAPEVTELVEWLQYGGTSEGVQYNIPQPVFASRKVTTSIVIWDGQTVVMGGLIREDLIKVHDKIPILGDIPLIGKLFQSNGEYSQKKNLLIFVTARLVDPAGKTIHKASDVGKGTEAAAAAAPTATP
jgi:general secretion pathway protein D